MGVKIKDSYPEEEDATPIDCDLMIKFGAIVTWSVYSLPGAKHMINRDNKCVIVINHQRMIRNHRKQTAWIPSEGEEYEDETTYNSIGRLCARGCLYVLGPCTNPGIRTAGIDDQVV